jgi:hypothetical protein
MEYCDRGSLTTYMTAGKFFIPATKELDLVGGPVLYSLYRTVLYCTVLHCAVPGSCRGLREQRC